MRIIVVRLMALVCLFVAGSVLSNAQVSPSGSITGTIQDPNGAVVVGATIVAKSTATGQEFKATTADNGTYTIPNVPPGSYTVTVTAAGFKASIVKNELIQPDQPTNLNVTLAVGAMDGYGDLIGTPSITRTDPGIGETTERRAITELPLLSRHILDLVTFETGVSTVGRSRQSTIDGLPKGAITITLDGINIQDNLVKSSDGFFSFVEPRIDAIDELTVSTAVLDASENGDGAALIKYVTRGGANSFSGSLFEYLRNPSLNANYYFNGVLGLPRQRVMLNQYGGRLAGPIVKDRAFFFVDYEEYRLPEQTLRQRTIFAPAVETGVYTYSGNSGTRTVNLLTLAAAHGQTATIDPTIGALLAQIRSSTSQGTVVSSFDPNLQQFAFLNKDLQLRKFPTVRFDFNITSRHHLENEYTYQQFDTGFDFLNGGDPAFPGFPNFGSQRSNRFTDSTTLRSTLSPTMVNEFRFGLTGGDLRFSPEVTPAQFANQGGFILGLNGAGISNATGPTSPLKRNSPVWQFSDDLDWTRGEHSFNFGLSFTQINLFSQTTPGGVLPALTFGVDVSDPAQSLFNNINFPGASSSQISQARNIYGLLTGRILTESGTAVINENGNGYTDFGSFTERDRQREAGMFAMDQWRITPSLILTGGLRWEIQFPMTTLNNSYSQTTFDQLFGISGPGNLFKPGTLSGVPTQFTAVQPGAHPYNTDFGDLAPSLGFAWSTGAKKGLLKRLFGEPGQTVLRGGYSIAFVREGTDVISAVLGDNPGATINVGVNSSFGNFAVPALLRNGAPALLTPPDSVSFPILGTTGTTASAFSPDLKTGRVHSFTFGVQREITKDMVIEARYVGNRAMDMWRQYNIDETNVVENGFLNEFKLAQTNLAANNAAGGSRAGSFAFFGAGTGTSPLPTILGFFSGTPAAQASDPSKYISTFFKNSSFTNQLNPTLPSAIGFANILQVNSSLFGANAKAAGIPANFFLVNPGVAGAFVVDNSNRSYYDALQVEFRRRLFHGLLVDASYVFSKSLTNYYASSPSTFKNFVSLHDPGLDRGLSPFDITQTFKTRFIYDLPVGEGHHLIDTKNGLVNRLVSQWTVAGTIRIQSGTPFSLGNVQLLGMTREDLQDSISIRKDPSGLVFYLPADIIQNTVNAFNGVVPTGRAIAPANLNAALAFPGAAGYSSLVLHGPRFTRFDFALVKKTKITERVNFEFRAELLNAFNNIDFQITSPANDIGTIGGFSSASFGQVNFAYQDPAITNDPGGRLVQFAARINF